MSNCRQNKLVLSSFIIFYISCFFKAAFIIDPFKCHLRREFQCFLLLTGTSRKPGWWNSSKRNGARKIEWIMEGWKQQCRCQYCTESVWKKHIWERIWVVRLYCWRSSQTSWWPIWKSAEIYANQVGFRALHFCFAHIGLHQDFIMKSNLYQCWIFINICLNDKPECFLRCIFILVVVRKNIMYKYIDIISV